MIEYAYYKIKLHNLTEAQEQRARELSGMMRYLYNYFLVKHKEHYEETKKSLKFNRMCSMLTEMRNSKEHEWLKKYHVTPERYALKDVHTAFEKFFRGYTNYPKFHSRKGYKTRFAVRSDGIKFFGEYNEYVYLPSLCESQEDLIYCGPHNVPYGKGIKYDNVRVKSDGIDYWLYIAVKVKYPFIEERPLYPIGEPLGIDVGIRNSAVLSDGTAYDGVNKHRLHVLEHRRRKLQSLVGKDIDRRMKLSMSTRTKYYDIPKSKNILKKEKKLRKTYIDIHNLYHNHYHQIARDIANKNPEWVVVEGIKFRDMHTDNYHMNHAIRDSRMSLLIKYIKDKCNAKNIPVITAPRFFPSTQICSRCGSMYKPGESKIYRCPECGYEIDRDLNAAINLRDYGMSYMYHFD